MAGCGQLPTWSSIQKDQSPQNESPHPSIQGVGKSKLSGGFLGDPSPCAHLCHLPSMWDCPLLFCPKPSVPRFTGTQAKCPDS